MRSATRRLAGAIALFASACQTPRPDPYPMRSFAELVRQADDGALRIAVEPVSDPEAQERHFGLQVGKHGLLPVYAIVENRDAASSLLVRPELAHLRPHGTPCVSSIDAAEVERGGVGAAMRAADSESITDDAMKAAIVPLAVVSPVLLVFLFVDFVPPNAIELRRRLLLDGLHTTTLAPGATARGLVVLATPEAAGQLDFCFTAVDLATREPLRVQIPLDVRGNGAP